MPRLRSRAGEGEVKEQAVPVRTVKTRAKAAGISVTTEVAKSRVTRVRAKKEEEKNEEITEEKASPEVTKTTGRRTRARPAGKAASKERSEEVTVKVSSPEVTETAEKKPRTKRQAVKPGLEEKGAETSATPATPEVIEATQKRARSKRPVTAKGNLELDNKSLETSKKLSPPKVATANVKRTKPPAKADSDTRSNVASAKRSSPDLPPADLKKTRSKIRAKGKAELENSEELSLKVIPPVVPVPPKTSQKKRMKFQDRLQYKMAHCSAPPTSTPKRDPKSRKVTKEDIESAFGFDDSIEVADYSTLLSPIAHTANPNAILPPPTSWKATPLTQRNVPVCVTSSQGQVPVGLTSSQRNVPPVVPTSQRNVPPVVPSSQGNVPEGVTSSKPKQVVKRPLTMMEHVKTASSKPTGESPFSQLLHRYTEEVEPEFRVDPKKILRTYASRKRASYEHRDEEADYDFVPKQIELDETPLCPKQSVHPMKSKRRRGAAKNADDNDDLDEEERKWLEEKNKEFEDVAQVKLVIENSFSD